MEFPLLLIGPVYFHFKGFWEDLFIIIQVLIEYYVSKQWTHWSDATLCGVWSVSALFVYVIQKGRWAYMG